MTQHEKRLTGLISVFILLAIALLAGCSRSGHAIDGVVRLTGDNAMLVENDSTPSARLARILFPMIPPNYETQIIDIGFNYTLSIGTNKCSQQQFENALLARSLVGFTFYAARDSQQFDRSSGVAVGFYESYVTKKTDVHGNMKQTLIVHRILLTMISKKRLSNVNPTFGSGGVISNGSLMGDPVCVIGKVGDFPAYPNEWGGFLGYSDSELKPFIKVFLSNGGKISWNKSGFVQVTLG
jgi:hypothetical protein